MPFRVILLKIFSVTASVAHSSAPTARSPTPPSPTTGCATESARHAIAGPSPSANRAAILPTRRPAPGADGCRARQNTRPSRQSRPRHALPENSARHSHRRADGQTAAHRVHGRQIRANPTGNGKATDFSAVTPSGWPAGWRQIPSASADAGHGLSPDAARPAPDPTPPRHPAMTGFSARHG